MGVLELASHPEERFIAEETRTAQQLFGEASQDFVVTTQRTIAERVIQEPRSRVQRASYYEVDSDSD